MKIREVHVAKAVENAMKGSFGGPENSCEYYTALLVLVEVLRPQGQELEDCIIQAQQFARAHRKAADSLKSMPAKRRALIGRMRQFLSVMVG
jgi:hypothetical protein